MATKKRSGRGQLVNTGVDKRRVQRDSKGRIKKVQVVERLIANPKSTKNAGQPWTKDDLRTLKQLVKENTPTRVIGLKLGRTPASVRIKASNEGISLKPTNQSPYNRRKR